MLLLSYYSLSTAISDSGILRKAKDKAKRKGNTHLEKKDVSTAENTFNTHPLTS